MTAEVAGTIYGLGGPGEEIIAPGDSSSACEQGTDGPRQDRRGCLSLAEVHQVIRWHTGDLAAFTGRHKLCQ